MGRAYRYSIGFGAVPLIMGVTTFFLWYFTRTDWLMMVGLVTILVGLVCALTATILLLIYLYSQDKTKTPLRRIIRNGVVCGLIIISNFPAAYICVVQAGRIESQYVLTVKNDGASVLSNIIIKGPGINKVVRQIGPEQKRVLKFNFRGDGKLEFSAEHNTNVFGGEIEGYVTNGIGGKATLVIKDNSQYEIERMEIAN